MIESDSWTGKITLLIIMCREGWCLGLGQEGVSWDGGYLNYLKRGWNRKEGRGNKGFKKGGQAWWRGGWLKGEGAWNPITYKLWFKKRNLIVKLDLLKPGLLNYGISQGSILGSILIIVIMLIMVLYFI